MQGACPIFPILIKDISPGSPCCQWEDREREEEEAPWEPGEPGRAGEVGGRRGPPVQLGRGCLENPTQQGDRLRYRGVCWALGEDRVYWGGTRCSRRCAPRVPISAQWLWNSRSCGGRKHPQSVMTVGKRRVVPVYFASFHYSSWKEESCYMKGIFYCGAKVAVVQAGSTSQPSKGTNLCNSISPAIWNKAVK